METLQGLFPGRGKRKSVFCSKDMADGAQCGFAVVDNQNIVFFHMIRSLC